MSKNAAVIVLVVVILAAVVIGVVLSRPKAGAAKDIVAGQKITLIDAKTLQTVEVVRGEYDKWEYDKATNYKKDPKTGQLLAKPIRCPNCGEMIPDTPIPRGAGTDEEDAARAAYKCPKCGRPVNQMGM